MQMRSSWQRRRTEFNHDWLKNQFIPALAKCLNLLDNRIEDRAFEQSFVLLALPEWDLHRGEAPTLAQDFEREMSPRRLFDQLPLSRCDEDTRQWLGNLVHALWITRYPVRQWVSEAFEAAKRADASYDALQAALAGCADIRSVEALRSFRKHFSDFRERCQELGHAISKFPNEVKMV
jgi:hypothetical protein